MAFKLRSGGGAVPFKQMGSTPSPLKKTYKDAYAAQSDEKKSGQTYEQFETAAKAWNEKKYGTTEPTRDGNLKAAATKPATNAEKVKPGGTDPMDQISRGEKPEGATKAGAPSKTTAKVAAVATDRADKNTKQSERRKTVAERRVNRWDAKQERQEGRDQRKVDRITGTAKVARVQKREGRKADNKAWREEVKAESKAQISANKSERQSNRADRKAAKAKKPVEPLTPKAPPKNSSNRPGLQTKKKIDSSSMETRMRGDAQKRGIHDPSKDTKAQYATGSAADPNASPKAEPTKKEARVAKRTERKEARTERKDTRRQARDMKEIGKLVAKDDKNKSRRAKNEAKYSPTAEQYAAAEKAIKSRT